MWEGLWQSSFGGVYAKSQTMYLSLVILGWFSFFISFWYSSPEYFVSYLILQTIARVLP